MKPQEKAQQFIDRYPVFDWSVMIDLSDIVFIINKVVKETVNVSHKKYWTEVSNCIKQHIAPSEA